MEYLRLFPLYFVKTIHISYSILVILSPFFTNNVPYLLFVLFCIVLNYYSWVMLDVCFLTLLEEYLGQEPYKYSSGKNINKSFITITMEEITGLNENAIFNVISILPAIAASVCIYKIYMEYDKLRISGTANANPNIGSITASDGLYEQLASPETPIINTITENI